MSNAEPQDSEPDPGRKLMIAALVGIGVLLAGVIVALGYFAWQAISRDGEARMGRVSNSSLIIPPATVGGRIENS